MAPADYAGPAGARDDLGDRDRRPRPPRRRRPQAKGSKATTTTTTASASGDGDEPWGGHHDNVADVGDDRPRATSSARRHRRPRPRWSAAATPDEPAGPGSHRPGCGRSPVRRMMGADDRLGRKDGSHGTARQGQGDGGDGDGGGQGRGGEGPGQAGRGRRRRRRPTACCATWERRTTPRRRDGNADHGRRHRAPGGGPAGPRVRARPDHAGPGVGGGQTRLRSRPTARPPPPPPPPPQAADPASPPPPPPTAQTLWVRRWPALRRAGDPGPPRRWCTDPCRMVFFAAGWSSLVARRAHNPKVGGSNPPPATKRSSSEGRDRHVVAPLCRVLPDVPPGESWERSSPTLRTEMQVDRAGRPMTIETGAARWCGAQVPDKRFRVRPRVEDRGCSGPLFLGTYTALPYAAQCREASRTWPVRCGFADKSSVLMAVQRTAQGMPYAGALLNVSWPSAEMLGGMGALAARQTEVVVPVGHSDSRVAHGFASVSGDRMSDECIRGVARNCQLIKTRGVTPSRKEMRRCQRMNSSWLGTCL